MSGHDELDALDGPVARHLARTLREVAAATPVSDRRDAIAALLPPSGADTVVDGPADGTAPRPRPRRTVTALAVAAVVLVVVAVAALAVGRGDDGSVDLRPAEDPGTDTGWYLPGEGWTVTAATVGQRFDEGDGACPCTTLVVGETGDDPAALLVRDTAAIGDEPTDDGSEPIDVGGRPGSYRPPDQVDPPPGGDIPGFPPEDQADYVVRSGGRRLVALSGGVDHEVVIAILDAWADRTDAGQPVRRQDLPLPEGLEAGEPLTKTWTVEHEVLVTVTYDATGDTVHYELAPAGGQITFDTVFATDHATFDGDAFTVDTHAGPEEVLSVSRIGGAADVVAGVALLGAPGGDPEVIRELAASLHEVTTAEWRAALRPVDPPVDAELLSAPTLFAPPLTG